jgi:spermidine/putrescine transport system substrate-binding protein
MSESTYESALSRRRLLQGAGVAVATVGASPWLLETANAVAAESKVGGTLDFLSWQGYDSPKSLGPWLKANGVKLKPTYIASHDDIQAKILALHGGKGYDIITYYHGYKELYDQLKILSPLDESKLPNLKGMLPLFRSNYRGFWVKNGVRTAVPMYWGALGLVYDSKAMTTPPNSYSILFEKSMKGKVTVDDDPVGCYTLAGHTLGINVARMNQAQFNKITAYLQKLVKQSKGVAPSYGDCAKRIADGDAVIGWPGWAAQVGFAAGSGNKNVRFVLPKEGGYAYCDSWAIPVSCDNPDTAYGYINNAIAPKVNAAAAIEQILGGVTVAGAVKYLDKQTRSLYNYGNLNSFFAKAPLYANPPVKSSSFVTIDKVIAKWQEIKASA